VPRKWTVAAARETAATPIEKDDWLGLRSRPGAQFTREAVRQTKPDLKLALERVQEARAARGVARSVIFFPSTERLGTRNRQRIIVPAGRRNLRSSSQ